MIDEALKRRFEMHLEFTAPDKEVIDAYYDQMLSKYPLKYRTLERKYFPSFAEVKNHIFASVKQNIITEALKETPIQ